MKYIKAFETVNNDDVKKGDYVICIDNVGSFLLQLGEIYQVSHIHVSQYINTKFYHLIEIENTTGWDKDRFRKATDEEISMKKYNL